MSNLTYADRLFKARLVAGYKYYKVHRSKEALEDLDRRYRAASRVIAPIREPDTTFPVHSEMDIHTYCIVLRERRSRCRSTATVEEEFALLERFLISRSGSEPIGKISFIMIKSAYRNALQTEGEVVGKRFLTACRNMVRYAAGDGLIDRRIIKELYDKRRIR